MVAYNQALSKSRLRRRLLHDCTGNTLLGTICITLCCGKAGLSVKVLIRGECCKVPDSYPKDASGQLEPDQQFINELTKQLVKGPQARRYTQKAVHTQGGTHKRRSVATAGVMLLKGPQARRYTQKAVHTKGGTHRRRSVATAGVMLLKGPQARRYTQKAVHTKGGTHKRRSVATAGVMLLKGPQARRYTQKAVHTKGGLWPLQASCY